MSNRTVPPFHLVQLGKLQEDFQNESAKFMHIMVNGNGLRHMGIGETVRNINILYLQIAAHLDAARDIDGQVSLDTGRHALAKARSLSTEDANLKE